MLEPHEATLLNDVKFRRLRDGNFLLLSTLAILLQAGGAYRDRTGDLMLAKHALSQLS